jgi:hypothetical protein
MFLIYMCVRNLKKNECASHRKKERKERVRERKNVYINTLFEFTAEKAVSQSLLLKKM